MGFVDCDAVQRIAASQWRPGSTGSAAVILEGAFMPPDPVALIGNLKSSMVLDTAVERSASPAVLYHSHKKPLAGVRGFHERSTEALHNVSTSLLLSLLEARHAADAWRRTSVDDAHDCPRRDWLYFSAPNGTAPLEYARSQPQLSALLDRISELAATSAGAGRSVVHSQNLWLGGAGVTSWNHYDASHNAFAQVLGTKHFRLTAPETAESDLEPYSYHHPHFRRTQLPPVHSDLDSPCSCRRRCGESECGPANLEDAAGSSRRLMEAALTPGDVLLLAPFQFHHVTASSAVSLSLNAWAHDASMRRVQHIISSAGRRLGLLPILNESNATRQTRAAVVEHAAISLVLDAMQLHSRDEARVWLHTRMTTRWKPVGSRYPKAMRKLERFCAPGEAAAARSALAAVHTPAEVAPAVRDAAAALRALRRLGGDALETANVVEQAALDVLQDVRTTGSFLTHCFIT